MMRQRHHTDYFSFSFAPLSDANNLVLQAVVVDIARLKSSLRLIAVAPPPMADKYHQAIVALVFSLWVNATLQHTAAAPFTTEQSEGLCPDLAMIDSMQQCGHSG